MLGQLSLNSILQSLIRPSEGKTAAHSKKRNLRDHEDEDKFIFDREDSLEAELPTKRSRKDSASTFDVSSTTSESSDSESGDSPFNTQSPARATIEKAHLIPALEPQLSRIQLQKDEIIKRLEEAFHIKISYKVLTDINFDETGASFISMGRPDTEYGKKQLRHVIPFSFVKKLISGMIEDASSPSDVLNKLIPAGLAFSKMQSGFTLTNTQLESEEYRSIQERAIDKHFRTTTEGEITKFFFSPSKGNMFSTPGKKAVAAKEFSITHTRYVKEALENLLQEIAHDSNTTIITSEILTRLMFTIFNSTPNSCFAPEGNSSAHEIRVYDSPTECFVGSKDYQVVTARELQTRLATEPEDLNNCIRIVNCEGSNIREINKALKTLDLIYSDHITTTAQTELTRTYNTNYNYHLQLANVAIEESYNIPITRIGARNYNPDTPSYHLAKLLYISFDLKALEDISFIYGNYKDRESISVYTSAQGDITSSYQFIDGNEARQDEIGRATGYTTAKVFRSREKDLELLPKKLAELFTIGTMSVDNINKESALDKLIHLAALDHDLLAEEANLHETTFSIYHELISASDPIETKPFTDHFDSAIMGDDLPQAAAEF